MWFHLKDNSEFVKLTAGKLEKSDAKSKGKGYAKGKGKIEDSKGSEQRRKLRDLRDGKPRPPNYISVCEFFGESMFTANLDSVALLIAGRVWYLVRFESEVSCGQSWIEKGPEVRTRRGVCCGTWVGLEFSTSVRRGVPPMVIELTGPSRQTNLGTKTQLFPDDRHDKLRTRQSD